jgi:hypothetical protein
MNYLNRRVGDRRIFAVEFELEPNQQGPPNEWYGSLWLWVEGRCIGESHEVEMVSIGLEHLAGSAQATGSRTDPVFSSLSAGEALDFVMWAVYGENNSKLKQHLAGSRERLFKFDILATSAGPFFDDWEATIIEIGDEERFIYRKDGEPIHEARWPLGTFKGVVLQAQAEFTKLCKQIQ